MHDSASKTRRLTGFIRANRADLIERALQKGDGIDVDADLLCVLLEHVAAIHRDRGEAAVTRSSKTRNPKGREAVEGDAPPGSRGAGRQASAGLIWNNIA